MASVNKVILVGNLGRDPEFKNFETGSVCNVPLATTLVSRDKKTNEKREETEWHRLVFYNRLAEIVNSYLKKGSPIYVEGRLKTRKWQSDDGRDNFRTEIIVENMQMLGGGKSNEA